MIEPKHISKDVTDKRLFGSSDGSKVAESFVRETAEQTKTKITLCFDESLASPFL